MHKNPITTIQEIPVQNSTINNIIAAPHIVIVDVINTGKGCSKKSTNSRESVTRAAIVEFSSLSVLCARTTDTARLAYIFENVLVSTLLRAAQTPHIKKTIIPYVKDLCSSHRKLNLLTYLQKKGTRGIECSRPILKKTYMIASFCVL